MIQELSNGSWLEILISHCSFLLYIGLFVPTQQLKSHVHGKFTQLIQPRTTTGKEPLSQHKEKKNLELKLLKLLHEVPSHLKAILSLLMFLFRYSPLPKEEERKMKGYQLNSYKGIER